MLKQTENSVKIEGILSEIDLDYGSFVKNGATVESIGGTIKVQVTQKINGEDAILEVPVHMFASKLTNKGTSNPAYESIEKIKTSYLRIAAGGIDAADRVRITGGSIQMNEYYNQNGQPVSFPRISASFCNRIKKEECAPEATFTVQLVVLSKGSEVDRDGIETGRYFVKGGIVQYGGKVDIVTFYSTNKGVITGIDTYWNERDTVKASGRLNFTSKTEEFVREVDFGEPVVEKRTVSVSELLITGGSQTPMEGDFAIDWSDREAGLTERLARLEKQKEKDAARAGAKTKSAPAPTSSKAGQDLGF